MCLILNVSIHMHVLHAIFYNNLTNYLYFMIKIVFNFKCIYMYMHVLHAIYFNNLTNYLYFYNKNWFNLDCIHTFAWVTC